MLGYKRIEQRMYKVTSPGYKYRQAGLWGGHRRFCCKMFEWWHFWNLNLIASICVHPSHAIYDRSDFCEAQGNGRAKGRPRKVTQRSFIDCRWWMVDILSLMLYTKFGWNHIADCSTVLLNGAVLQWSSRLYAWSTAPPQVSLSPGLS